MASLLLILFAAPVQPYCPSTDRLQNDSEENIQTIPTIGFNVEVLQYKNIKFQVRFTLSRCFQVTESGLMFVSLLLFFFRSGTWADRHRSDPIGVVIIPTQTLLFSWWTRATWID